MTRKAFLLGVMAAVVGALAAAALRGSPAELELRSGSVLETPRPIAEFELVDQHGQAFTRERLKGGWSLVFIGFTQCPDVCPTTLAVLDRIGSQLRAAGHDLQAIFVSVDPERDTPEVLERYVGYFSDEIIGATGSKQQLNGFCEDLGFAFVKVPGSDGDYTVDHSGALALIDPHARVAAYFMPPFESAALSADLAGVLAAQ